MKVLFATDGTVDAKRAGWIAARVPCIAQSEWTVATVVPPPYIPMMGIEPIGAPMISEDLQAAFDAQLKHAKLVIESTVRLLNDSDIRTQSMILEGDVAEELCELARSKNFDLIVLGSRGQSAIASFFLGSTAKTLLHRCRASILIGRKAIKSHEDRDNEIQQNHSKLNIGIGFDGSTGSKMALEAVAASGREAFKSVALIAALPLSRIPTGLGAKDVAEAYEQEAIETSAMLHQSAAVLDGVGESVTSAHATGEPGDVLLRYAEDRHLDLLVLGSAQEPLIDRILVGSTADKIATHAPCSVWIVRPNG